MRILCVRRCSIANSTPGYDGTQAQPRCCCFSAAIVLLICQWCRRAQCSSATNYLTGHTRRARQIRRGQQQHIACDTRTRTHRHGTSWPHTHTHTQHSSGWFCLSRGPYSTQRGGAGADALRVRRGGHASSTLMQRAHRQQPGGRSIAPQPQRVARADDNNVARHLQAGRHEVHLGAGHLLPRDGHLLRLSWGAHVIASIRK